MNAVIVEDIRQLKRQLIPNEKLFLFGSQSRGDARPDSDWDLLLLLNKQEITLEDERLYAYPFTNLGWNYGAYFSVKLYSENDWQKRSFTPFYKNVEQEGINII
jgi:predicted nucleotidyltransferase